MSYLTTTTHVSTTGRVYWCDENGIAHYEGTEESLADEFAAQQAAEIRAEFGASFVAGGGDPADVGAAWSQFGDRYDGVGIRDEEPDPNVKPGDYADTKDHPYWCWPNPGYWERQYDAARNPETGKIPTGWEPTGTRHNPHWANND